jgi:hypothetical protein
MFRFSTVSLVAAVLGLVIIAGCEKPPTKPDGSASGSEASKPVQVELGKVSYAIRGPHSHENFTVFLLCSNKQDENDYLTLDEGLKRGDVKVSEMENETVGTLHIENASEQPLYLQEGERLQGGKQDRIIIASLVIPPKSGKTSIPTFCVEHDRWHAAEKGSNFGATVNPTLATKGIRGEAKVADSQQAVWDCVGTTKCNAVAKFGSMNNNSSINETLDDPKVRKLSEEYAGALKDAITGSGAGDIVGVVIVLNDAIEEVDVYPNHKVLERMYPRLVLSYALYAAMLKDKADSSKTPQTIETVAKFLESEGEKSKKEKELDANNRLVVDTLDDNKYRCTTTYQGKPVHLQIIKKIGDDEDKASGSASGSSRRMLFGAKW